MTGRTLSKALKAGPMNKKKDYDGFLDFVLDFKSKIC